MEFERRRAANRRYSLRSFARALAVDHSSLSQILRGRRRVKANGILALGRRLGVAEDRLAELCAIENDNAVLGAVARPGFRANSRWLAITLGIPIDAVNIALQRLLRTGALIMKSRERWQEVPRG